MFASLGLARQAAIHGVAHDRSAAQRAHGEAQEALARAERDADRPVWLVAFYDQAELHGLALTATLSLGDYQTAEYHAHRCLAELRPHMIRSKALTTTRLAHAQLAQGDAEAATATAMTVAAEAATQHVRVSGMLQEFGAALRAMAPGKRTVDAWTEHTASWRTNA